MIDAEERKFVIMTLQAFLDGSGGAWDFDDLVHYKYSDHLAQAAATAVDYIPLEYPSHHPSTFCSPEGFNKIQKIINELKLSIDY